MNLDSVPVLMYHSIKYKRIESWIHKHLSLELNNFYRHLIFFSFFNFKSYFMDDLSNHLEGKQKLPFRSVVLTFDDGYRDNWVFAFPLLKKYNIKATIWVNPEFVDDNDDSISPNLSDYWDGKISLKELNNYDGFLNWAEMHEMEKSGLIDIQSHTMSHTQYPNSNEIIDFVNPNTKIDWMLWNKYPDEKINYLRNFSGSLELGSPIYKHEKANIARIVKENGYLTGVLLKHVETNGGNNFFNKANWKSELMKISEDVLENNENLFLKETEDEYENRVYNELFDSKRKIEEKMKKKVSHLCWPFGAWDDKTLELAKRIGYKSTTAKGIKNSFNKIPNNRVDRFSIEHPKYQNKLFYLYSIFKFLRYKISN